MSDTAPKSKPLVVILTGGIAAGKSAVSERFAEKGIPVVDTDRIARELVRPGMPALDRIETVFGSEFLLSDGNLDRAKMRTEIFANPNSKRALEAILHPAIAKEVAERIEAINSPYCVLVVPLYTESTSYRWADLVLVVDVPERLQVERLTKRDGISKTEAERAIDAQANRQKRAALADDVIGNEGSLSQLDEKVEKLHRKYLALSKVHKQERGH